MVGKFRIFDSQGTSASAENDTRNYVSTFSTEALTEPEILHNLQEAAKNNVNEKPKDHGWRVKRLGPDESDHYWFFGKIHGLENIAYLTPEQIKACNGNPVKLQLAINEVEKPRGQPQTYEQRVANFRNALNHYKEEVDKRNLTVTDRKRLLALPFYMMKRHEVPEPK